MKIRSAAVTGLLALALAGCSSGATAATPNSNTSSPTTSPSTAAKKCTDFPVASFIGAPAARANDIKGLGWNLEYADYDGKASSFTESDATILGVQKHDFSCLATVTVKIQPASSAPATPAGPLTTVSDGTYLVGTDMEPGSYKTSGGKGCYWARLKDDTGRNIIANNLSDGPARFTAKKGEYVEISRCTFTKT